MTGPQDTPTVIAVLGSNRSGSSCTAGVLHALGVSMGERFQPPNKANPKGYYEALGLKKIALAKCDPERRIKRLRRWLKTRARIGPVIGAKHYYLCKMVAEMVQAWPKLKVIAIERPMADVVQSQRKAGFRNWLSDEQLAARSQSFVEARDRGLEEHRVQTLRVQFADLIAHPHAEIERIIEFIGIRPTSEQVGAALEFVDPSLRHFDTATNR